MFIALPAIYGVAMSLFVERLLRSSSAVGASWGWLFGLLPWSRSAPRTPGIGLILLMFGGVVGRSIGARLTTLVRSPTVTWIGRAILPSR